MNQQSDDSGSGVDGFTPIRANPESSENSYLDLNANYNMALPLGNNQPTSCPAWLTPSSQGRIDLFSTGTGLRVAKLLLKCPSAGEYLPSRLHYAQFLTAKGNDHTLLSMTSRLSLT